MEIITPSDYVGTIMELSQQRRGDFEDMQYLTEARTTLVYSLPLAEVCLVAHAELAMYHLFALMVAMSVFLSSLASSL